MKNILFIILLYATLSCHGGNGWDPLATKAAVKDAIKGGEKLINLAGPILEKTSEVIGKGAATALADGVVKSTEIAAPAIEGAARGVGVEVAKVFAPYVGPGIILFAGSYSITQLYPIGKEIYQAVRPTEDQKNTQEANTIVSRKRLNFLKTEETLRNCLMSSADDAAIGTSGCPTHCEKTARLLALFGGRREVDEMIAAFTEYGR